MLSELVVAAAEVVVVEAAVVAELKAAVAAEADYCSEGLLPVDMNHTIIDTSRIKRQ